jgi:hypothetical protein
MSVKWLEYDSFSDNDPFMFLYLKKFVIGMSVVIKLKAERSKMELSHNTAIPMWSFRKEEVMFRFCRIM